MTISMAVDIETGPNLDRVNATFGEREEYVAPEYPGPPKNWKNEELIANHRKDWEAGHNGRVRDHADAENKRYQKHLDRAPLRAELGEVLCISYYTGVAGHNFVDWARGDERGLLKRYWFRCLDVQRMGGRVYSASGTHFDLRFPWRRSILLGVEIPGTLNIWRWQGPRASVDPTFVDLSEIYGCGEYGHKVRVDDLAIGMGLEGKEKGDGVTGANFWKMCQEDPEAAERYALQDAKVVWEMAQRMQFLDPVKEVPKETWIGER